MIISTKRQDNDFVEKVIGNRILENSIDWVRRNLDPEDVFDRAQLIDWALDNDFVERDLNND